MSEAEAVVVALITTPPEAAETIATSVVEAELAACVNIVAGVRSIYRWEGAVQQDEESLLVVKTRATLIEALTAHVRGIHPYANPEVVALRVEGGSEAYLAWIIESTAPAQAG